MRRGFNKMAIPIPYKARPIYAKKIATRVLKEGKGRDEICEELELTHRQYQALINLYPEEVSHKIFSTARNNTVNKKKEE